MKKLKAFLLGIREFRLDYTWSPPTYDELLAYDRGRELAHIVTLRRFDY